MLALQTFVQQTKQKLILTDEQDNQSWTNTVEPE